MGCPDLVGTCIANYGNHTSTFPSKLEEIMSKYRPIAPKPTKVSQNLHDCSSNSDHVGILDSSSRFAKGNHVAEGGRPSRTRRRALDCCVSPSSRGQKRARGLDTTGDLASEKSHSVGIGSESIRADRSKIASFLNGSFMVDRLIVNNDPYIMAKEESSDSPSVRTMLDKKNAGLGTFNIKGMISSVGNEGVWNHSDSMDEVSLQRMPEVSQCGSGFAKYLVFPILGQIQQEESIRDNLVTLPLLPETPPLKDSVLNSLATNLSSIVSLGEHKASNDASYDKEEFQFRLFWQRFKP